MDQPGARDGWQRNRRASDQTPLGRVLAPIEIAFGTGDYERCAALLERDLIVAWYGFTPDRIREMLEVLTEQGATGAGAIPLMRMVFATPDFGAFDLDSALDRDPRGAASSPTDSGTDSSHVDGLRSTLRMYGLRAMGRPVEALAALSDVSAATGIVQPLFDARGGLGLFSTVQSGITAMLAGDFARAIVSLTQAQMHVHIPALSFLSRDALVKLAIVHAAYGDPERARGLLDTAQSVPRTESWVEPVVDASAVIAEALLDRDHDAALRRLDATLLNAVGEMWPFYALAVHRALVARGDLAEEARRRSLFSELPLARVEGQGYTGSVLELTGATSALIAHNLGEARRLVDRADPEVALTSVVRGVIEIVAGRPSEAQQAVAGLRHATRDTRQLEIWRLSVVAGAHLALGERDDACHVLEHAMWLSGGLRSDEARFFTAETRQLGEAEYPGWPILADGTVGFYDQFPAHSESLTARELDVLRALGSGRSREEIARAQFVSMNTLKAHLRAVYRKLGVNSRAAAVLEGERRGLL